MMSMRRSIPGWQDPEAWRVRSNIDASPDRRCGGCCRLSGLFDAQQGVPTGLRLSRTAYPDRKRGRV